jgi:hypothetical protein
MAFAIWDWDKKPQVSAKLTAKLNNLPPWGKRLYGFELDNGEVWYTWGYFEIVKYLAPLPFLTKFDLRYLGKGEGIKGKKFMRLFEFRLISLPDKTKKLRRKIK